MNKQKYTYKLAIRAVSRVPQFTIFIENKLNEDLSFSLIAVFKCYEKLLSKRIVINMKLFGFRKRAPSECKRNNP